MISASSPAAFAAAVDAYCLEDVPLDVSVPAGTPMLLVGEPHGVHQTPNVLYALARALQTRALALEWSHEEMDEPLQAFLRTGAFEYERLWALPESTEFFRRDGRITAGHFALLRRLREEDRLEQVIAFDRLDPDPRPAWQVRDREMADRLLAGWDRRLPLLSVAGAFHARADTPGTMAAHLQAELPALQLAMLEYAGGPEMPPAPISIELPPARPAIVPGLCA